jgi:hypothetical protein
MRLRRVSLAILPLLGGCMVKDRKGPEAAVVPAQVVAAVAAPAVAPPPVEDLPADPRLRATRQIQTAIIRREHDIARSIERLADRLASLDLNRFGTGSRSVRDVRRVIEGLHALATDALTESHRSGEILQDLIREARHLGPAFRSAADAWRDRAEDYQDSTMRATVLGYAADADRQADLAPARFSALNQRAADLAATIPFLRETARLLSDTLLFLDQAAPEDNSGRVVSDETLRLYARAFTTYLGQLREFLAQLRSGAVSPDLQSHQSRLDQEARDRQLAAARAAREVRSSFAATMSEPGSAESVFPMGQPRSLGPARLNVPVGLAMGKSPTLLGSTPRYVATNTIAVREPTPVATSNKVKTQPVALVTTPAAAKPGRKPLSTSEATALSAALPSTRSTSTRPASTPKQALPRPAPPSVRITSGSSPPSSVMVCQARPACHCGPRVVFVSKPIVVCVRAGRPVSACR